MSTHRLTRLIIACMGILFLSSQAHADILVPDDINKLFYNNYENVFDTNGQYKAPGIPVQVGDHIVGIINVQNIDVHGSTIYFSGFESQLTGVFAQRVVNVFFPPDPFDLTQTTEPHIVLGPPTLTTFCRGADCFDTGLSGNEIMAIYKQMGAGTSVFESNGSLGDDVAKATDGTLWLTLGYGSGPDGIAGTPDDDGYFYAHTDGNYPSPDEAFAALNAIVNNTGFAFGGLNDINEGEIGGVSLFTNLISTSELERNPIADSIGGTSPWQIRSNDPAIIAPFELGGACRVTGGGVDTFVTGDGLAVPVWNGTLTTTNGNGGAGNNKERYQFGGQAGAPTALPPQPWGEWTQHQQRGHFGSFTFHGGTASAPEGTEIVEIRCSDPGFCFPARPAPTKQIDFDGIGTFKNIGTKGKAVPHWLISGANVTDEGNGNTAFDGTFHFFQVNIDDGGEPGNENSADKKNPGKGNPGICPVDGFGEKGSVELVNCDCPDFYRLTIYNGVNAADVIKDADGNILNLDLLKSQPVIYEVYGYPDGGNLQIHPLTGFDASR